MRGAGHTQPGHTKAVPTHSGVHRFCGDLLSLNLGLPDWLHPALLHPTQLRSAFDIETEITSPVRIASGNDLPYGK